MRAKHDMVSDVRAHFSCITTNSGCELGVAHEKKSVLERDKSNKSCNNLLINTSIFSFNLTHAECHI